jgi:hypothetical protein
MSHKHSKLNIDEKYIQHTELLIVMFMKTHDNNINA